MIDYKNCIIEQVAVHKVGNKTHQENKAEDIHGLIQKLAQFTSKKHPDLKINREN